MTRSINHLHLLLRSCYRLRRSYYHLRHHNCYHHPRSYYVLLLRSCCAHRLLYHVLLLRSYYVHHLLFHDLHCALHHVHCALHHVRYGLQSVLLHIHCDYHHDARVSHGGPYDRRTCHRHHDLCGHDCDLYGLYDHGPCGHCHHCQGFHNCRNSRWCCCSCCIRCCSCCLDWLPVPMSCLCLSTLRCRLLASSNKQHHCALYLCLIAPSATASVFFPPRFSSCSTP